MCPHGWRSARLLAVAKKSPRYAKMTTCVPNVKHVWNCAQMDYPAKIPFGNIGRDSQYFSEVCEYLSTGSIERVKSDRLADSLNSSAPY